MDKKTYWYVVCLCGLSYILDKSESVECMCGVRLVREGETCYSEIDDETYDFQFKPYSQPSMYKKTFVWDSGSLINVQCFCGKVLDLKEGETTQCPYCGMRITSEGGDAYATGGELIRVKMNP